MEDYATISEESELHHEDESPPHTRAQAWALYTSHALSTWNARTYEFAAILFTAAAFPDTLLASSIRGLSNTLAALCFSSSIGSWIDSATSRQRTLLTTISTNRASVILACFIWIFLTSPSFPNLSSVQPALEASKAWLFALVLIIGIFEKLSGIGNMISMERDWVPVFASQFSDAASGSQCLTRLNSVMRRIDLTCKLLAPLVISFIIWGTSMRMGIMVVGGTSAVSWGFEIWAANCAWRQNPQLRAAKTESATEPHSSEGEQLSSMRPKGIGRKLKDRWLSQYTQLLTYFSSDACVPSLSLALLHLSVLSYSATFITFLLNSGFSLLLITIARALGSVVEVSSTFITPIGVDYLAKSRKEGRHSEDDEGLLADHQSSTTSAQHFIGLTRGGLWGISMQLANLLPVVVAIWYLGPLSDPETSPALLVRLLGSKANDPHAIIFLMFTFLSISRLGLWVFDLTTQEIAQIRVPSTKRSSFAGTEMAFVSLFELTQWVLAAIVSKPEKFRWLALISLVAVTCSFAMYAFWVRKQRGHLIHWGIVGESCRCVKVANS